MCSLAKFCADFTKFEASLTKITIREISEYETRIR